MTASDDTKKVNGLGHLFMNIGEILAQESGIWAKSKTKFLEQLLM